jgi:hypothetical protein
MQGRKSKKLSTICVPITIRNYVEFYEIRNGAISSGIKEFYFKISIWALLLFFFSFMGRDWD